MTTTEKVRLAFTDHEWDEYVETDSTPDVWRGKALAGAEFDQWLADCLEKAWDEGQTTAWDVEPDPNDPSGMTPMQVPPENPYRKRA